MKRSIKFLATIFLLFCATQMSCGGGGGNGGGGGTTTALTSLAISPTNPSVPAGSTRQFTALGTYSDGTAQDITTQVTWSSSNTSVATVNSSSGLATGAASGSATITAAFGGFTKSTSLTVTAVTLNAISVFPANPSVPAGTTQQFTALGTYSDGTNRDITAQVTWSSSNTPIAAVDVTGLATGAAAGSATITAALGSITGSTTFTVTAATLTSITVTPANSGTLAGHSLQLTASGTYSDGTSQGITTLVTWTSSNTPVATVIEIGLAFALAPGTSTITATYGSVSGTTTFTVPDSTTLQAITLSPSQLAGTVGADSCCFHVIGTFPGSVTVSIPSEASTWTSPGDPSLLSALNPGAIHCNAVGQFGVFVNFQGFNTQGIADCR